MLVLVGSGAVGKTTMSRRLRKDFKKEEDLHKNEMTDGIEIKELKIKDVDFKIMDFAGQKDYAHTHSLFFKEGSVYLAVCDPRAENINLLENYLQMVEDFAPDAEIILISTKADDAAKLKPEQIESILKKHPNIKSKECISVDSVSGTNIGELKKKLVKAAKSKTDTRVKIPQSLKKFESMLGENTEFSISNDVFTSIAVGECQIDKKFLKVIRKLLVMWGSIYELKDDFVALHPQQLADVLACVVSSNNETLVRTGIDKEGLLNHEESILERIWGSEELKQKYDKDLWSLKGDPNHIPPFLDLLYSANLAFPLLDQYGEPLHASLIPAMLPDTPVEFNLKFPNKSWKEDDLQLYQYFQESSRVMDTNAIFCMETVTITTRCLPMTLVAQLQVKLKPFSMIGGAWKSGFGIVTGSEKYIAILYATENNLVILSDSRGSAPRTLILESILDLCSRLFKTMKVTKFNINVMNSKGEDVTFQTRQIDDAIRKQDCYLTLPETISEEPIALHNLIEFFYTLVMPDIKFIPKEINALKQLKDEYDSSKSKIKQGIMGDFLTRRTLAFFKCIPKFTELLCTKDLYYSTFQTKALWVILSDNESKNYILVPMTPTHTLEKWEIINDKKAWINLPQIDSSLSISHNKIATILVTESKDIKSYVEWLLCINDIDSYVFDEKVFVGFMPVLTEDIVRHMQSIEGRQFVDVGEIFISLKYAPTFQGKVISIKIFSVLIFTNMC